jgi:hypothetical protein
MLGRVTLIALLAACSAAAGSTVGVASAPPDVHSFGDTHEGIGQGDTQPLRAGVIYQASAFPLAVRLRAPDSRWGGVQDESGRFRFVQLNHLRTPVGSPPLHGVGYITLEAARGSTPSATEAIKRLHATPHLKAGPITPTRLAGYDGEQFDATIVGSDLSGTCLGGNTCPAVVSFAPFLTNHHCGFCGDAKLEPRKETHDVKAALRGQIFRIIALDVRGKTVVVYVESGYADQPRFPPAKTYPTFLPYARQLLATLRFPAG